MSESKTKSVVKGALLLVLANIVVKAIGVFYKIPLGNILGEDGMGYFSAAFEIHQLLLAISTAGLPVALSKMISESYALGRYNEIRRIHKTTLIGFLIVGIITTLLMYFGAGAFSSMINSSLAIYSIKALAPSVFFVVVISIFRGYFQGLQSMTPTASTQIVEAVIKLGVGIALALFLANLGYGQEFLSAGAIFGVTVSTFCAAIILIIVFALSKQRKLINSMPSEDNTSRSSKRILIDIVKIAVPVTAGSMVVNLTGFLDLFLIMNRLIQSGMTEAAANALYGTYKGFAQTIFNLPPSIITSINVSIIPAIAAATTLKHVDRRKHLIESSLKIIILLSVPFAIGISMFSGPILAILYPMQPQAAQMAAPLLSVLGIATITVSVASLTTAIMQGMGKVVVPVLNLLVGGSIKLLCNYFLVGIPSIGIYGAPFGTNLCYLATMILNLYFLSKYLDTRFNIYKIFVKPLFAGGIMGVSAYFVNKLLLLYMDTRLAFLLVVVFCVVIYAVLVFALKIVEREDILSMPLGKKLVKLTDKLKITRE